MKPLKKYISIVAIFTFFLVVPVSLQITPTKIISVGKNDNLFSQREVKISLQTNISYASRYFTNGNGGCTDDLELGCILPNFAHTILIDVGNYLVGMSGIIMDFFLSHSIQS